MSVHERTIYEWLDALIYACFTQIKSEVYKAFVNPEESFEEGLFYTQITPIFMNVSWIGPIVSIVDRIQDKYVYIQLWKPDQHNLEYAFYLQTHSVRIYWLHFVYLMRVFIEKWRGHTNIMKPCVEFGWLKV